MKTSTLVFVIAILLGVGWTVRASDPCRPTTHYPLGIESITIDGTATTTDIASGHYSIDVVNNGGASVEVKGIVFDPITADGSRVLVLARAQ